MSIRNAHAIDLTQGVRDIAFDVKEIPFEPTGNFLGRGVDVLIHKRIIDFTISQNQSCKKEDVRCKQARNQDFHKGGADEI